MSTSYRMIPDSCNQTEVEGDCVFVSVHVCAFVPNASMWVHTFVSHCFDNENVMWLLFQRPPLLPQMCSKVSLLHLTESQSPKKNNNIVISLTVHCWTLTIRIYS